MKSVPRALALCLALALGLALFPIFPATTLAASTVIVGNTDVTAGSDTRWTVNGSSLSPVTDDSWTVKYESGVLTLRGANIAASTEIVNNVMAGTRRFSAIYANGDLTIHLEEGAPSSVTGLDGASSCGVYVNGGSLTINGTGILTAQAGNATGSSNSYRSYGVCASFAFTINSGTLIGKGGSAANSPSYGVWASTSITVNGGTLTGTGGEGNRGSYGVCAESQHITVSGGTLTGTGGEAINNSNSIGVWAYSDIKVEGSGSLIGKGGTASRNSIGVWASNSITVSGGTLTGESNDTSGTAQAFDRAPDISRYPSPVVKYGNSSGNITGTGYDQATVDNHYAQRYMYIGPYTPPAALGSIPETGDSSLPGLWLGLALLALAGLGINGVVSRKKRHSN